MIALSTSPVFGHHLAARADMLLAGRDHLFNVCLIALHHLLAPVHYTFHALLLVGLGYAIVDRTRAWFGWWQAVSAVDAVPPDPESPIGRAATRAGMGHSQIRVVEALPNPAFTAGWWRPRVYVAAELAAVLDEPQLAAVLAHEAAHVARRDPLRLSLLRFLACTLFYLPALRRLAEDAADEAEIAADDVAAGESPLVLAETILVLASAWGSQRITNNVERTRVGYGAMAVGFQRVDLLERRVRRLVGEDTPIGTHVTRGSLAGAATTLFGVLVSGLIMAHPLPAQRIATSPAMAGMPMSERGTAASHTLLHCRHPGELAITHLFCLGFRTPSSDAPCPHQES